MILRKFSELGTVHRNQPCQEYPGVWNVNLPASVRISDNTKYATFQEAQDGAKYALDLLDRAGIEFNPREITISWSCSDDDPRVGKTWFTPFYVVCRASFFGGFVST